MAIITSIALALLAQGPVEAVAGPQADYDVGYEELVSNENAAARKAIENCDELAENDPARLINHGIALARTGEYDAARAEFKTAAMARDSVELQTAGGAWVDSRHLARKALALGLGAPAQADGDVTCNAGPQSGWAKMSKLKKKAWLEEWELLKMQVEGDCYEVYARTKEGQSIEAFFHPVTLKKLVVFRRGQEIYRAEGFTG